MSCNHPLKAFPIFISPETGKQQYKICEYDTRHVWFNGRSFVARFDTPFPGSITEFIEVPCGQCIACRIQRSREWANRCLLELTDHPDAPGYFVTLTYDDWHIPYRWYADQHTGEAMLAQSLFREDVQLFLKRLRKNTGQELRYFGCGEYGPQTFRPHYHLQIFGLELNDLVLLPGRSELGYPYYRSETLEKAWSFPMRDEYGQEIDSARTLAGHVCVGEITWETCAYTARYITKKLTGPASAYYDFFNIDPPFSMMSLKPGIGRMYYDTHPELYQQEYIYVSTEKGGRKFRPPKYFDKLYDIDYPEEMARIKETRKLMAEESKRLELSKTDLPYMEYLACKERALQSRLTALVRNKV